MPQQLGSFLRRKRTAVLQRWQLRVAELTRTLAISRIELLDHMPSFVDGVIALFDRASAGAVDVEAPAQENASLHGAQRLQVGFDVDEVIREYGILADVLLEAASDGDVTLTIEDHRRLLTAVNAGAAEAVREYVRRRDEELAHEQARHRAFIAHELRTPLSTALAASQLLANGHPDLGAGRPLQLLDRSLGRARELIDQMLIAGRLAAGAAPDYADVDVAALMRDLEDALRLEAESRQVTLALDVPPTAPMRGDARLLHSALANVMRNAVKYTRSGTTVRATLRDDGDVVVVEVADDCGGIVDGNWASIFEPYARGDEAAQRQREGLGLGLAIAKEAAEAHSGTLAVRNVPSEGCVFELRLPRRPPS
jgi:signal transduction histidine kinase